MSRLTQYSPFSSEPFADVFQAFLRPIRQNGEDQAPGWISMSPRQATSMS